MIYKYRFIHKLYSYIVIYYYLYSFITCLLSDSYVTKLKYVIQLIIWKKIVIFALERGQKIVINKTPDRGK